MLYEILIHDMFCLRHSVPRIVAVDQPLATITVVAGNTVKLTCPAHDVTPAMVTWKKDGQSVNDSDSIRHQRDGSLFVLVRSTGDAGQFECAAANDTGNVARMINLVVHGKREPFHFFLLGTLE